MTFSDVLHSIHVDRERSREREREGERGVAGREWGTGAEREIKREGERRKGSKRKGGMEGVIIPYSTETHEGDVRMAV